MASFDDPKDKLKAAETVVAKGNQPEQVKFRLEKALAVIYKESGDVIQISNEEFKRGYRVKN